MVVVLVQAVALVVVLVQVAVPVAQAVVPLVAALAVLGPELELELVVQQVVPAQVRVLARPVPVLVQRVLLVRPARRLAVLVRRRSAVLRLPQPLRQE